MYFLRITKYHLKYHEQSNDQILSVCLNRLADLESMKRHRGERQFVSANMASSHLSEFPWTQSLSFHLQGAARARQTFASDPRSGSGAASGCGWQICKPEWDLSAPDVTTPPIPSESSTSRLYVPRWGNGTSATATSPRNLIVANWTGVSTSSSCTVPILMEFSVRPYPNTPIFNYSTTLHLFIEGYTLSFLIFRKY